MKDYDVSFSFYSEEDGRFDDRRITVKAEDQFAARKKAWEEVSDNPDFQYASCLRLCGVTWKASPLDLQDWLYAEASYHKYELQKIENVKKPNADIDGLKSECSAIELERAGHYGSLYTINSMASDFGRPHGMLPPMIHAELHYAREFLNLLWEDFDKFNAFEKKIKRAEKWEPASMLDFRDSLNYASYYIEEHSLTFSEQLEKDGLCPIKANREENISGYVRRWTNEPMRKNKSQLTILGEKDIIANSHTMQYDYQTLVIKIEALPIEKQKPINSLWVANQPDVNYSCEAGKGGIINVENAITGDIAQFTRDAFWGVLRPEKYARIDFEAIKAEYGL